MAKQDKYYYENYLAAADCCCDAAKYLHECLANYNYDNLKEMLEKMHSFEHAADEVKHEMSSALAKAFVTPMDREDMALISANIDEVADCIEEVLQRLYVDKIQTITPESVEFSEKIVSCCELMREMLTELPNFKKPRKLHEMIIDLSHREEDCDRLYLQASLNVVEQNWDALTVMFWREVYERMEKCADACEHVGDCVETVVMKNS